MSRASSSRGGRRGVYVEAPKADIYTALLAIALGAIVIACFLLFLELRRYGFDASAPTSALPAAVMPATQAAVACADSPQAGDAAAVQDGTSSLLRVVSRC
jgi:hypothetical protein